MEQGRIEDQEALLVGGRELRRAGEVAADIHCSDVPIATLKMRTQVALTLNGTLTIDYTTPGEKVHFPCT